MRGEENVRQPGSVHVAAAGLRAGRRASEAGGRKRASERGGGDERDNFWVVCVHARLRKKIATGFAEEPVGRGDGSWDQGGGSGKSQEDWEEMHQDLESRVKQRGGDRLLDVTSSVGAKVSSMLLRPS